MFICWFHENSRDRPQVLPISLMKEIIINDNKLTSIEEIKELINCYLQSILSVQKKHEADNLIEYFKIQFIKLAN